MPIITVNLLEGRSLEQKKKLIKNITEATVDALQPDTKPENVRIIINEMPYDHFAVGGMDLKSFKNKK